MGWLGLNSVLNVEAQIGTFNQEQALVGAFLVIVQLHRLIDLRHYSQPSSAHLPTTLPTPMSSLATNAPMTEVASSGAELPAAMKVAPATSGDRPRAATQGVHICHI